MFGITTQSLPVLLVDSKQLLPGLLVDSADYHPEKNYLPEGNNSFEG